MSYPKIADMGGKKFGKLSVVSFLAVKRSGGAWWICRCECGSELPMSGKMLRSGRAKSCGCTQKIRKRRIAFPAEYYKLSWRCDFGNHGNLKGKRFSRLLVGAFYGKVGTSFGWECKCDCGNKTIVTAERLVLGHTTSCGCYREEQRRKSNVVYWEHYAQYRGTREYTIWKSCRLRAEKLGLDFNIEPTDISIPAECPVLKIPIIIASGRGKMDGSPSIDRIVPIKGYTKGNIRIISWKANRIKGNATPQELIAIGFDALKHTSGQYCGKNHAA